MTLSSFEKRCQLLPSLFKRTQFRALGDQLEARRLIEDKYLIADVHVEWRGSPVAKPANFTEALTLDGRLPKALRYLRKAICLTNGCPHAG